VRALPLIAENGIGADDPPESQWGIRIAGVVIGVICFGGFAECGSEAVGVVIRKCIE